MPITSVLIEIANVLFVGGSLGGRRYLVESPKPGRKISTPLGELYFFDPMSGRFICRWPPYSYRVNEQEEGPCA